MRKISDIKLLHRIERLNDIGKALSAEQDVNKLLEMILLGAKELTNADGGSLYINEDQLLNFSLIHTTSLDIHMGGTSDYAITFPPIPMEEEDGSANMRMVVSRAANEGAIINIPDAYADIEYDLSGTREFDARNGYRSQSLLAVPLQDHENKIIGVLQLINVIDPASGEVQAFSATDESLVSSLASQAAIALTRKQLIDGLEELLQSLVKLIATAIDDKSPHTGGHCRRVPPITMGLARALNEDNGPLFGELNFTDKQFKELEMAAWLHDCGKITTPEYVVDKHTRLEALSDRIHLVDARLEILRRDQGKAQVEENPGVTVSPLFNINEMQEFIHACNSGGSFIDDEARERLAELSKITVHYKGQAEGVPLLSDNELYNLSIARGTLTNEERNVINNHVAVSIRMLESLPFPEHLRRVPEIAGGHHERMDGKGYPRGIPAAELPVQARILAIADVFEALTANDRGYRKPNTVSAALTIMAYMCKDGHIDPDLLELFILREAYLEYTHSLLLPEQIDTVDVKAVTEIFYKG